MRVKFGAIIGPRSCELYSLLRWWCYYLCPLFQDVREFRSTQSSAEEAGRQFLSKPHRQCSALDQVPVNSATSTLIHFVPSNSEWVTSPSPSNIGAKRSKVGVGQEKPDESAHILTVNIAVLPSLSDTISLFFSPIYSESSTHLLSITHPSIVGVINIMLTVITYEKYACSASEN